MLQSLPLFRALLSLAYSICLRMLLKNKDLGGHNQNA